MSDEHLRKLERAAANGDGHDKDRLVRAEQRAGLAVIRFGVPGKAVPKANKHKIARRGFGRNARRSVVNDLTGVVAQREASFVTMALNATSLELRDTLPWGCPIEAEVTFVFEPTASWPKWKREAALSGALIYTKTPDLENVAKFVFDALEKVFYTDDKLIFKQTLNKCYGLTDRVIVTLRKHTQATRETWKDAL